MTTDARVSEAVARPVRGIGQGGVAYLIIDCLDEFTGWEPTTRQYGLAVLALGVLVSFIQNLTENRLGKGFLRQVPPVTVPVIDDKGESGLDLLVKVCIGIIVVVLTVHVVKSLL